MTNENARAVADRNDEKDRDEAKTTFSFTYDDTGAVTTVEAPNGWTMQRVIDEGYGDESPQPDDRVEFAGPDGPLVMTPELRALHVKQFVERRLSSDLNFHIVSKPGGAYS